MVEIHYSLSWGEKNKAFHLPCEIDKNVQAKTSAPPPPYLMVPLLVIIGWEKLVDSHHVVEWVVQPEVC